MMIKNYPAFYFSDVTIKYQSPVQMQFPMAQLQLSPVELYNCFYLVSLLVTASCLLSFLSESQLFIYF